MFPEKFYFPLLENRYIQRIRSLTTLLDGKGYKVVCVGGAARDVWHNKKPKDFDFILLNTGLHPDVPMGYHGQLIDEILCNSPEFFNVKLFDEYPEDGRLVGQQVNWIIKGEMSGDFKFDIISPVKVCQTVEDAVLTLDCTLNAAWFELNNIGAECHTLPGMYPDMMDIPSIKLLWPKSCTAERIAYLQSKYPQYRYDINPDEFITPEDI